MYDDNTASSDPLDDEHLPAAGEVSDDEGNTAINPDISDDMDLGDEDEDLLSDRELGESEEGATAAGSEPSEFDEPDDLEQSDEESERV